MGLLVVFEALASLRLHKRHHAICVVCLEKIEGRQYALKQKNIDSMARIYDNIETKFQDGLKGIISNLGVKRVDFCVGYFNLRGWDVIVDQVDELSGDYVYENDRKIHRICRLLIGMHQPNE